MSRTEIRLAGSGGQGVILASVILAEAAIEAGKYTTQSQSYGPEARGGACKAETLISDEPIGFTKVQHPDFLLVLTQQAMDKYGKNLPENCIVLMDSSITAPPELEVNRVIDLPILKTAREKVGRLQTANVVAIGCINTILHIVDEEAIEKAVLLHVPKGTEEMNLRALKEGIALGKEKTQVCLRPEASPAPVAPITKKADKQAALQEV